MRVLEVVPAGAQGAVVRYAVRWTCRWSCACRSPARTTPRNGAAALAVALAAGVAPVAAAAALEKVDAAAAPLARCVAAGGRTILDDCYNANPASMSAALATVVAAVGGAGGWARAFAVLGDMLELGPEVGGAAPRAGPRGGRRAWPASSRWATFAGAVADGARAAGLAAERDAGRGARRRKRPR